MAELILKVAGEQRDPARLVALASGLTPAELAELLDELRRVGSGAGRHGQQHVASLCRLLLALESTREDAIVICVRLIHDQRIRDKAGMGCLPELRAAIMQRASGAPELTAATVSFLQRVCEALVGFLSDKDLADKTSAQVGGHLQALELLPTVLECAGSALLLRGSGGEWQLQEDLAEVRATAVQQILEARWPKLFLLPLFSALSEVDLSPPERHAMYGKVEDGLRGDTGAGSVASSRVDLESNIVGLIQVALEAAGRYRDDRAMGLVRRLLHISPPSLLSDVLCVVHMALQNGTIELGVLIAAIHRAASGPVGSGGTCRSLHGCGSTANIEGSSAEAPRTGAVSAPGAAPAGEAAASALERTAGASQPDSWEAGGLAATDITLLLSAAQNPLLRDAIMDTVTRTLLRHAAAAAAAARASSSCQSAADLGEAPGVEATQRLAAEVVISAEGMWLSSLLLDLAECLLEVEGHESSAGRKIGQALLENLFHWQPHARGDVLSRLFASLTHHVGWPQRLASALVTLKAILRNHLLSLRTLEEPIVQGFALLWLLPLHVAQQCMVEVLPACRHAQTLRDRLLLTIRKELYCGEAARVRLAVFGQVRSCVPEGVRRVTKGLGFTVVRASGEELSAGSMRMRRRGESP